MQILHLSDWHCGPTQARDRIVSEGLDNHQPDILAVTGDMLPNYYPEYGNPVEAQAQRPKWEKMIEVFREAWPKAEIVAVPGNHDFCDYWIPMQVWSLDKFETQSMTVKGLRISGFRGVPAYNGHWHGERDPRELEHAVAGLDPTADIILTHAPPYGILDRVWNPLHIGITPLAEWFRTHRDKRRLHLFGHVHENGGQIEEGHNTLHSNAATMANLLTWPD